MSKKNFWLIFIFAQLFLLINEPYALRWFFPFPELKVTGIIFLLLLLFFLIVFKGNGFLLPSKFSNAVYVTFISWGMYGIFYQDSSYFTRMILLLITYCFLLLLYRNDCFEKFWLYNNRFICLQTFFSLISFLLISFGLLNPIKTVFSSDFFHIYKFYGLICAKTGDIEFVRPAGYFDEAGALAGWAFFGLMLNYAFIKDNIYGKIVPWFTIVTLSIAYYIQIFIFLILTNIKSIYKIIPIIILFSVAIPYVNETEGTEFDIYSRTIGRFEFDSDKGISGNNRQNQMNYAYQLFEESPLIGQGGHNIGQLEERSSDNPYEVLAKDGIIGYIVTYLPLLLILLVNRKKEILIALFLIFVGYQQRPFHYNFLQDLYLWSFLLFALLDKKKKIKEDENSCFNDLS